MSRVIHSVSSSNIYQDANETMDLPMIFQSNPMLPANHESGSNIELPLELLAPLYTLMFINTCQSVTIHFLTQSVGLVVKNNTINILTHNKCDIIPTMQTNLPFEESTFPDTLEYLKIFAMTSLTAKCTRMVIYFGMTITKLLKDGYQLTYQNEKIIGWVVTEGTIDLDDPRIMTICRINIKGIGHLNRVTENLSRGVKIPKNTDPLEFRRGQNHAWLTFVTESGQIFDLDLSALQFHFLLPTSFLCQTQTIRPSVDYALES